jgi:glycerate kinase
MVILIAPDKFKGTLTAAEVADALAAAARSLWPNARLVLQPLADGGEGTVDALRTGIGGTIREATASGPLGAPVDATYVRLVDGSMAIEVASVTGFRLVPRDELRPLEASSRGVGELVLTALEREGEVPILVGIGGTTSTDGGTGAASAIGHRFLDRRGRVLPDGGGSLEQLARIDGDRARRPNKIVALADVSNPLLGERGCARVYAPQKGADASDVEVLEAGLSVLAERIRADLGIEVADLPGAGAGGGLGAGLVAFMGAELTGGIDAIIDAVGLEAQAGEADVIVTGEGSLDRQTLEGKVPAGVLRVAQKQKKPCVAVAGRIELSNDELQSSGFSAWSTLVDAVGEEQAMKDPSRALFEAAVIAFRYLRQ